MNSLRLSSFFISYATLQGKPLHTYPAKHCSAKLVPRSFRAVFYILYVNQKDCGLPVVSSARTNFVAYEDYSSITH